MMTTPQPAAKALPRGVDSSLRSSFTLPLSAVQDGSFMPWRRGGATRRRYQRGSARSLADVAGPDGDRVVGADRLRGEVARRIRVLHAVRRVGWSPADVVVRDVDRAVEVVVVQR